MYLSMSGNSNFQAQKNSPFFFASRAAVAPALHPCFILTLVCFLVACMTLTLESCILNKPDPRGCPWIYTRRPCWRSYCCWWPRSSFCSCAASPSPSEQSHCSDPKQLLNVNVCILTWKAPILPTLYCLYWSMYCLDYLERSYLTNFSLPGKVQPHELWCEGEGLCTDAPNLPGKVQPHQPWCGGEGLCSAYITWKVLTSRTLVYLERSHLTNPDVGVKVSVLPRLPGKILPHQL